MELVSPAGNPAKLKTAWLYGADAAYVGVRVDPAPDDPAAGKPPKSFSLRAKSDNFSIAELDGLSTLKAGKKLYSAFNIFFSDGDLEILEQTLAVLPRDVFDAFIVSDIGTVAAFKKFFPDTPLHLSTQANCTNAAAAERYRDLGFTRIIAARELSLREIEKIKRKTGIEIEVFCHGAMCLAYSGRCFLSTFLADRSANQGDCAHACRWDYRVLEESARPGEYFPVIEGDGFTSILSSKDLCMIDHLGPLRDAGVDAIKIEGRMKSVYYTAVTTRAYRMALDALASPAGGAPAGFREELFKVSHREFSTGFFFGKEEIERPTLGSYVRDYLFMGMIGDQTGKDTFKIELKNRLGTGEEIEYTGFDVLSILDRDFILLDGERRPVDAINHGLPAFLQTNKPIKPGYLIRKKLTE